MSCRLPPSPPPASSCPLTTCALDSHVAVPAVSDAYVADEASARRSSTCAGPRPLMRESSTVCLLWSPSGASEIYLCALRKQSFAALSEWLIRQNCRWFPSPPLHSYCCPSRTWLCSSSRHCHSWPTWHGLLIVLCNSCSTRWIMIFFPVKATIRPSQSSLRTGPVRAVAAASGTNTQETICSRTAPICHSQPLSGNVAEVPTRAAIRQRLAVAPGPISKGPARKHQTPPLAKLV